jgi:hypothetical protein
VYAFPLVSVTVLTVAVESLHPTITTFRFPAVCALAYTTDTVAPDDGSPAFNCTLDWALASTGRKAVKTKRKAHAVAVLRSLKAFIRYFPS